MLKTVDFVALEFRKRFVAAKILLTPGNNDEYCGDYSIDANGAFLHDTAERARELAMEGEQFSATWKSLGSYSVEHPTLHGVRILSLNTIFWSDKYRAASFSHGCATVNSTAAGDLLTWLESQLAEAEQSHEKVWLMFHIPPGIDGWATTHPYDGPRHARRVVREFGGAHVGPGVDHAVRQFAGAISEHGLGELRWSHPRR